MRWKQTTHSVVGQLEVCAASRIAVISDRWPSWPSEGPWLSHWRRYVQATSFLNKPWALRRKWTLKLFRCFQKGSKIFLANYQAAYILFVNFFQKKKKGKWGFGMETLFWIDIPKFHIENHYQHKWKPRMQLSRRILVTLIPQSVQISKTRSIYMYLWIIYLREMCSIKNLCPKG